MKIITDESIERLIQTAIYPSPHNTQPALWKIENDGRVYLNSNEDRWLKYGDPNKKDHCLALGAAFEAMAIASTSFGLSLDQLDYHYEESINTNKDYKLVAKAVLKRGAKLDPLFQMLKMRRCWRGKFKAEEKITLENIINQLNSESLHIITGFDLISDCSAWYDKSTFEFLKDSEYEEELFNWLRFLKTHPKYNEDGLNADCLNLNVLEATVAHFLYNPKRYKIIAHSLLAKMLCAEKEQTKSAPFISLFLSNKEDSFFFAGRQMLKNWLKMTAMGYYGVPLSSLTDRKSTAELLTNAIGISKRKQILFAMRCGRPVKKIPRSHRLPVEKIKIYD